MSVSETPLRVMHLSTLQQLRYFREPTYMHDWLRKRSGDLALLRLVGDDYIAILTPEGVRQVFSADPLGYDVYWKESFTGLHGEGSLFVLVGEKHRKERLLLSPAFHASHFHGYGKIIDDIVQRHIEKWQPGETRKAIDATLSISLDVIMRVVLGAVEDDGLAQEGRRVISALLKTIHPLLVFLPALQRPWFPLWRQHTRAKAEFSNWLDRYLALRRSQGGESDDALAHMLAAHYEDGSVMRDEDIRDELLTILLAGHNTTATAMAWALYELGRHPAALAKLRAELDALGPAPDLNAVVKLPYLSAVCNETLRLHTILAEMGRVLTSSLKLFGHTLQPGVSVIILIMAIHHDPALYPNPDSFIPERFIERSYGPFEFLPFGGGHRRCLGAGLSEYEMRVSLARIVKDWNFEPAAVEREVRRDIAMGPKHGVPLRIIGRRN